MPNIEVTSLPDAAPRPRAGRDRHLRRRPQRPPGRDRGGGHRPHLRPAPAADPAPGGAAEADHAVRGQARRDRGPRCRASSSVIPFDEDFAARRRRGVHRRRPGRASWAPSGSRSGRTSALARKRKGDPEMLAAPRRVRDQGRPPGRGRRRDRLLDQDQGSGRGGRRWSRHDTASAPRSWSRARS